jgi:hypothetical protein
LSCLNILLPNSQKFRGIVVVIVNFCKFYNIHFSCCVKDLYPGTPDFFFSSANTHALFNKYKTFSVLIYSYINTSGNWENEKLCGNTTPEGRRVFTQFRVFPISTSLYLFYNIAQRNIKKEIFRRFRVDIELYQHGSWPISVQNLQMLYYNKP